ncbi:hypothetical protein DFH06DRAFT_392842 [Mycena polygramma]|nr:hypothetical protein DFH06DRAFT_392842 [Mycena polygramma]
MPRLIGGRYVGGFFPKAEHFTVSGGTFKNVSHIHNAPAYRDFRMIPPGDLDLRHEKGHSVVYRRGSPSVRRVYSSQIHGSSKAMTAVVFQGDDANERLREEISQYTNLRHPQILQLYGVVNARGIHATIFHDDLIPYRALRDRYRTSHFSTVYFWACLEGDFSDVDQYMATGLGRFLHWSDYTVWIRSSTGRLCLELTASGFYVPLYLTGVATPDHLLLRPPEDLEIAASMSLEDYHEICHWHLCQFHQFPIYTTTTVNLGSIRRLSGAKYRNSFEIAISHEVEIEDFGWAILDPWMGEERYIRQEGIVVMENAWMRCDVYPQYRRRICTSPVQPWSWLAQANHIVDRLGISYNPADYFLTDVIHFWLTLNETRPPGYLFLCPLTDLQTDTSIGFRTPECAAYWSFNPSGADRLSPDEARRHGFPHLRVQMEVWGKYWDSSVYAGIREFHKAKGFDPYSQQVAIELGCPPFEITCDPDLLRRYGEYQ